jgi:hypothetical protein
LVPLHPPVAVHVVASVELQSSDDDAPFAMLVGFAVSTTVGAATTPVTVTVAACVTLPPAPLHASVKVVVLVSGPVSNVPLVALVPLHPFDAVHAVALVEVHVNVAAPPLATLEGSALRDSVGTDGDVTVTVTVRAALIQPYHRQREHVNVKLVVAVSGPVD